jgi:peptide/nickel transport system permease protein
MVEALSEDYVRTAKAKGLPQREVVYKHALRAALVPVVTIFGIDFGTLLAGTIFTEKIFDIDGIGLWALLAVGQKDLPIVQATALFAAVALILSNLLVDLLYSVLDPRVRLS